MSRSRCSIRLRSRAGTQRTPARPELTAMPGMESYAQPYSSCPRFRASQSSVTSSSTRPTRMRRGFWWGSPSMWYGTAGCSDRPSGCPRIADLSRSGVVMRRAMTFWAGACLAGAILPVTLITPASAQTAADTALEKKSLLLVPGAVWDGSSNAPRSGWVVLVRGSRIDTVGPADRISPADAERIDLPGTTLIPGLIEGHSHLFLHPYNEAAWDDQVLREPLGVRMARGGEGARATLRAGITTERDLGTEGALNFDVQLKRAIEQGIVPGPRLLTVTRAIVATGSYAPRRTDYAFDPGQGAEEASGVEEIARVVRSQIGHGADWIKVYADYRWGLRGEGRPTFTQNELNVLVETARTSGRPVAAHATTPEGIRRAVLAGVETIEHGDEGNRDVFRLMRSRGVALCP